MIKRVTVEIEYPEGVDGCWDSPNGEMQVFHDVVICGLGYAQLSYATEIAKIEKNQPLDSADKQYRDYLEMKLKVTQSLKIVENSS